MHKDGGSPERANHRADDGGDQSGLRRKTRYERKRNCLRQQYDSERGPGNHIRPKRFYAHVSIRYDVMDIGEKAMAQEFPWADRHRGAIHGTGDPHVLD